MTSSVSTTPLTQTAKSFWQGVDRISMDDLREKAFASNPHANAPSGNRGQRQHPLGEFQTGHGVMGKQFYDVRYNVDFCKGIILYWERNAYSSSAPPDGHGPIRLDHGGSTYDISCHIDITTPRANMLWHGVQGPHVVIEGYRPVPDNGRFMKPQTASIWLSPNAITRLYAHILKCKRAGVAPNQTGGAVAPWPDWFYTLLRNNSFKPAAVAQVAAGDSDSEDGLFDLFG